jgi:hypothetical protein
MIGEKIGSHLLNEHLPETTVPYFCRVQHQ